MDEKCVHNYHQIIFKKVTAKNCEPDENAYTFLTVEIAIVTYWHHPIMRVIDITIHLLDRLVVHRAECHPVVSSKYFYLEWLQSYSLQMAQYLIMER